MCALINANLLLDKVAGIRFIIAFNWLAISSCKERAVPGDPKQCRNQAVRCTVLAAETTNPQIKERLLALAQHWNILALDLEAMTELLDEWGSKEKPPQR